MTDNVAVSLITAAASIVSVALGVLNTFLTNRNASDIRVNTAHTLTTQQAMVTLEKSTNGMKDELVKVVADAKYAEGLKAGEARSITSEHAVLPLPLPVVIVEKDEPKKP